MCWGPSSQRGEHERSRYVGLSIRHSDGAHENTAHLDGSLRRRQPPLSFHFWTATSTPEFAGSHALACHSHGSSNHGTRSTTTTYVRQQQQQQQQLQQQLAEGHLYSSDGVGGFCGGSAPHTERAFAQTVVGRDGCSAIAASRPELLQIVTDLLRRSFVPSSTMPWRPARRALLRHHGADGADGGAGSVDSPPRHSRDSTFVRHGRLLRTRCASRTCSNSHMARRAKLP